MTSEGQEKAVNGSVSAGCSDTWCSESANRRLPVDLRNRSTVRSVVVRHAGEGDELPGCSERWEPPPRPFDSPPSRSGAGSE